MTTTILTHKHLTFKLSLGKNVTFKKSSLCAIYMSKLFVNINELIEEMK